MAHQVLTVDVLVVGGGTGGTAAVHSISPLRRQNRLSQRVSLVGRDAHLGGGFGS
uniref:Uncharacterized protein n=1 Tax=Desertifilum tharense IPPAS B-1220 TaxID=1781255 RepID=A0ACD5GXW2_9CYAN